jgi:DNA segregation ATPase FtsK/SpoIIIE, S-DNA-T family
MDAAVPLGGRCCPGHAGGVLGYVLGPLSMQWLGFAGSGVLWIAAAGGGMALALRFSWLAVAEAIGERIDRLRERRAATSASRKTAHRRAGPREREHVVEEEREAREEQEPPAAGHRAPGAEVPKSERVAKERQQPLFTELSRHQAAAGRPARRRAGRQETVTPESLEMTSRLIEKKLKDFGVEVRVVAASARAR